MKYKEQVLTVGQLKELLRGCPDRAVVCCQSDEEGNRTIVCTSVSQETVGKVCNETYNGKSFSYTEGEDVIGLDLEEDKGLPYIVIRPLY